MPEPKFLKVSDEQVINLSLVTHLHVDASEPPTVIFHFGYKSTTSIQGPDAKQFIANMPVNLNLQNA